MRIIPLFAIAIAAAFQIAAPAQEAAQPIQLSLPGLAWSLEINAPGFAIDKIEVAKNGNAARLMGKDRKSGAVLSAFLEKARVPGDAGKCRDFFLARMRKSGISDEKTFSSASGEIAFLSYWTGSPDFINLNAYLSRDGYWIDVHLSSFGNKGVDLKSLQRTAEDGISIKSAYAPKIPLLVAFGWASYESGDFKGAIRTLEKALSMDGKEGSIQGRDLKDLSTALGISYASSGETAKAKSIFAWANGKEPDQPLTLYNLACACAELGESAEAMENLRRAFANKAKLSKEESLPDPASDSSFKELMRNKSLAKEIEGLKQAR